MEAQLTVRVECRHEAARRFVRRMLGDDADRPLSVEAVPEAEASWFEALESVEPAQRVSDKGERTLYLTWTLRDEEEARECLSSFAAAPVEDLWAVLEGDEGWYLLYTLRGGRLAVHERWNGRSLDTLFDGRRSLEPVLDRLRSEPPGKKKASKKTAGKRKTILDLYAEGDLDALSEKLAASKVDFVERKNEVALFLAALEDRNLDVVRLLAGRGRDPGNDDQGSEGSLLHRVARWVDDERIRRELARAVPLLAAIGLDVDEFSTFDEIQTGTPLMAALSNGNIEVALALIEAGADVDRTNPRGRTALFFVPDVDGGRSTTALLDAGADVNHVNGRGPNALFPAAQWNNLEAAEVLVAHGIDVNRIDEDGRTPLQASLYLLHGLEDTAAAVALLLLEHGADPGIPMTNGASIMDNPHLRRLLAAR